MAETDCFHPVVVAPTFDNARTLAGVLGKITAIQLPVIVVDDGCRDGSATLLQGLLAKSDCLTVVTHLENRGKAAALLSGFERAREMGFTHAVTIDTDGQLDPAEIPNLLRVARESSGALVVGSRDVRAADYPFCSRIGRGVSNLLLLWESGADLTDSQCGMRVYPLQITLEIPCRAARYGFETEVLARAAWAGVPIVEVPVRCTYHVPEGRVTHFRKWRDSWSAARMHVYLLARSLAPWPVRRLANDPDSITGTLCARLPRWFSPARAWRAIQHDPAERSRFAAGLAIGVFIANLPLYGVQTLLSLLAARRLRLHPLAVVVGSHLSTPPIGPLLVVAAISVGHWIIHGEPMTWGSYFPAGLGYLATLRSAFIEWMLGSVACGAILGIITYLLARLVLSQLPASKGQAPGILPAGPLPTLDRATPESAV